MQILLNICQVVCRVFLTYKHTMLKTDMIFPSPSLTAASRGSSDSVRTPVYSLPSLLSHWWPWLQTFIRSHPELWVELHPPNRYDQILHCLLGNGVWFGNTLCRCNEVKIRSYCFRVSPDLVTGIFIRTRKLRHGDTEQESHVTIGVDIGVMCLQAKKCQHFLAIRN